MSLKDKSFSILQTIGRSFFLPISILPVAGLLLGIGSFIAKPELVGDPSLTTIQACLNYTAIIMTTVGGGVFDNLPLLFAMAVTLGFAKEEKAVAVLASAISFIIMHLTVGKMLFFTGQILPDGTLAAHVTRETIGTVLGIQTLEMGVFGGIIIGIIVGILHNRFYKIELPDALSFFGGVRFTPIISILSAMILGIVFFLIWPYIQDLILGIGKLVDKAGYAGAFVYGFVYRLLIPFGLHHVFYAPFWYSAMGGSVMVDGVMVDGAQRIFFAQLASPNTTHFHISAARFMAGEYPFMLAGLPAAALAMYQLAKPSKKKIAGGLLFSAALTCFLTGITEPIEFTFLFVAPVLYLIHSLLAGLATMLMYVLKITIGTTFSCGIIDFVLYGVLPGNAKTNWVMMLPVLVFYFFAYYFIFLFAIKKWNLQTPGREPDDRESALFTKADYLAAKAAGASAATVNDEQSALILQGLGGKENIIDIGCCATRLRVEVKDNSKVAEGLLKKSGAIAVIIKGHGIQMVYGPRVGVIKPNLETYIKTCK